MSNSRYTHIQAHGTPSALEPSTISHSNSSDQAGVSTGYSVDVNVDVTGAPIGTKFVIGGPVPPGCVVSFASWNTYNAFVPTDPATTYGVGLWHALNTTEQKDGQLTVFAAAVIPAAVIPVAAIPPLLSTPPQLGTIVIPPSPGVPVAPTYDVVSPFTLLSWYPVLEVLVGVGGAGVINVKYTVSCP